MVPLCCDIITLLHHIISIWCQYFTLWHHNVVMVLPYILMSIYNHIIKLWHYDSITWFHFIFFFHFIFLCYSPILTIVVVSALQFSLVLAFLTVSILCEGEPPPPISTPWGAYSGAASCSALNFLHFAIITSSPYTRRIRNPVVGHESDGPQVVFYVHQSHRHDSTHPSLFYWVGYHSYTCGVQLSWAWSWITFWAIPVGQSSIHVLTRLMIA